MARSPILPAQLPALPHDWQAGWDGRAPLALPDGGQLHLHGAEAFERPLQVRARVANASCCPVASIRMR